MAWDEQRDLRARHAAGRGGTPPEPPATPTAGERIAALREPLRRNGTMIAVVLAAAALLMSGIALVRSGHDGRGGRGDVVMPQGAGWQGGGHGMMGPRGR